MVPVAVRGRREVQLGAGVAAGVALETGGAQAVEVVLPEFGLLGAQLVQVGPGVQAGVVAVGEGRLHRVVADRVQRGNADFALAHLQNFLALSVAAHFGRWRVHAQQLEGNRERGAVVKADVEHARFVVDRQVGRLRGGGGCTHFVVFDIVCQRVVYSRAAMRAGSGAISYDRINAARGQRRTA